MTTKKLAVLCAVAVVVSGLVGEPAGAQPASRQVFVYEGGEFVHTGNGEWVVKCKVGPDHKCTQLDTQPDYIELYDRTADVKVRLHNNRGYTFDRQAMRWQPWSGSEGYWKQ